MSRALIAFLVFVVGGAVLLVGYYFLEPVVSQRLQEQATDARDTRGTITIGVDSWVGYFPLCSPELRRRLRAEGYILRCIDDEANLATRMARLASGEIGFAVTTADAFLTAGATERFPGSVIAVIDESKGGDALVARTGQVKNLDALRADPTLKIAFTPQSPSEHLLRTLGVHFDVAHFRDAQGAWRVETQGSREALEKLLAGQVAAAVLWEPDVSKALREPEMRKILGTERMQGVIVDLLTARHEVILNEPEMVRALLDHYFMTLRHYQRDPQQLRNDLVAHLNVTESEVDAMLRGVRWVSLQDNARAWFGVSHAGAAGTQGLSNLFEATVRILIASGAATSNPIPSEDPYRIQTRSFIEKLFSERGSINEDQSVFTESLTQKFEPLSDSEWQALRDVGTLKIVPITFAAGRSELSLAGKAELDRAAENLSHYPDFRVVIRGHTSTQGDSAANTQLSLERADAVKRYLVITYGIDDDRIRSEGRGGSMPLPRRAGESQRAYEYRLPRVELALVADESSAEAGP